MSYSLPYFCPFLSPRYFLFTSLCSCYVSSILYARIFKNKQFSVFALFLVPFSVYGIRRYVVEELEIDEGYETSALKSVCCINSLVQDLHEMHEKRIGVYKFKSEPIIDDSSEYEI
ncbi:hypothetical protein AAJ76_600075478 [Vairimorpha ceranae]|uniref:Uncharacterized protein n=1 Tax=Vairimorpha ceranae TaxID=40302 RepID=A0A0F9WTL6_9MICR|nr:hypothetical protein AAJ76_600075478 [Vairimorpha ceranae]KAF5140072.1 hypothetical protein G9O61_00g017970 [Vairimorpha ceranae]KKO76158.1 hypothetical protein AAJ76_600075478 [Vairimorpha ceranae]